MLKRFSVSLQKLGTSIDKGLNEDCSQIESLKFKSNGSGQIIIFHQPRCPWNKKKSLTKPPFGVRSCEVAIIWPEWIEWLDLNILRTSSSNWIISPKVEKRNRFENRNHLRSTLEDYPTNQFNPTKLQNINNFSSYQLLPNTWGCYDDLSNLGRIRAYQKAYPFHHLWWMRMVFKIVGISSKSLQHTVLNHDLPSIPNHHLGSPNIKHPTTSSRDTCQLLNPHGHPNQGHAYLVSAGR